MTNKSIYGIIKVQKREVQKMFVLDIIRENNTDTYEFESYETAIRIGQYIYNKRGEVVDVRVYPKK